MGAKKFIVELDADERARLNTLISKGKAPAKMILGRILCTDHSTHTIEGQEDAFDLCSLTRSFPM